MSAQRRVAALILLLAGTLLVGCGRYVDPDAPPAPRETPPPTAYIGVIATPEASAPAGASVAISPTPGVVEVLEQARAASPSMPDPPVVTQRAASPVVPRIGGSRARVVDRVQTTEMRVALTFDAGADRGYAESILDTLRAADVRASFGMTGQWAEANPDLLRRMAAEGHHFINHTQTHDSFTGFSTGRGPKSAEARVRELDLTEAAVQRIANATTKPYFRPPYGDMDGSVSEDIYGSGYDVVAMWTVDSLGWNGLSRAGIEARCLRLAGPGAIYIFHVGAAAQDGPALPAVIDGLRRQGYQIGPLDWLLGR